MYQASKNKQVDIVNLMFDNVDQKPKWIRRDKEYYKLIKGAIPQEDITKGVPVYLSRQLPTSHKLQKATATPHWTEEDEDIWTVCWSKVI